MAIPKVELLPSTTTNFTNGLIGIALDGEVLSCEVIEELNGQFELEMRYPIDGQYYSEIGYRSLLMVKPNPYDDPEPFRIYKIVPNAISRIATIYAQHISYDLAGIITTPFEALSAQLAFDEMVDNAVTSCPFTFVSTVSTAGSMKTIVPMSIRKLQGGVEGSIIDTFGGEYGYHLLEVRHLPRRGADRGSEIRYGKNLKTLQQEKNCASVYTGILPYYYSDEEGLIQGDLYNISGSYDFVRILDLDCSSEFDEAPTKAQLNTYAGQYATANEIGIPRISLKIDFVMLENTVEYGDSIALSDRVFLGDTIGVYFEKMGVNTTARVIRLEYDALADHYINVEVGRVKSSILTTVTQTAQAVKDVTQGLNQTIASSVESAVQRATGNLTGQISGHIHYVYEDGKPVEMMILDTDNPLTATQVWRWNMNGLGYSGTGINGPYSLAIVNSEDGSGEIVADFITAGVLDGSILKTGTVYFDNLADDTKAYIVGEVDGLRSEVTTDLEGLDSAVRSYIDQKANAIDVRFSSINQAISDGDDANATAIGEITSHILIEQNKMTFMISNSPYKLVLTNQGIQVLGEGDEAVCEFTANGVLLPQETVVPENGTFTLGNFKWTPRDSGNLSLVKV